MSVWHPAFELYGITDQASARGRDDREVARALIAGGVTCLQYRAKKVSALEQWRTAKDLASICRRADVTFIVNDRVDLALEVGADGVHLGQDDLPLEAARRLAAAAGRPALLIGRSTHTLEQALQAQREGADYIGYGPLYATQTKENNVPPVGVESLGAVLAAVAIPVVAIGGIKPAQLQAVAAQGARHCAVVTWLTGADDITTATRNLMDVWRRIQNPGAPLQSR
jgi:thiamine-phosphate pyrophosphorylase